jgi:hypothetical protein
MAEIETYSFSFKEIVEALIKGQDIHEGIWGINIEFGLSGTNLGRDPESKELMPAAIIPVLKIGIRRYKEENNLSVDASKVNPKPEEKANSHEVRKVRI